MPSSDDELPEELEDTAARVRATLHAAAREMPATTPDDERVPARSQWPARAAWLAAAAVAVVLVGVLIVVGRTGDGGDRDVVTGPPVDGSLPDLGFPDDLVVDAGRVRAKLGIEPGQLDTRSASTPRPTLPRSS